MIPKATIGLTGKKSQRNSKCQEAGISNRQPCIETDEIKGIERVRKRAFLGTVSEGVPFTLAAEKLYLQPWPYREQTIFCPHKQGVDAVALVELQNVLTFTEDASRYFMQLRGIIFPKYRLQSDDDADQRHQGKSQSLNASDSLVHALHPEKYYLGYEQPLHSVSGLLEAKIKLPLLLRKKIMFDLLVSIAICHERVFVHRSISSAHSTLEAPCYFPLV